MRAHQSIILGFAALALTAQVCYGKMSTFGMSIGLGEYAVLGQPTATHAGLYPCWGLYASFRVHERLSVVPQIAVEVAPETGQWGFSRLDEKGSANDTELVVVWTEQCAKPWRAHRRR